MMTSSSTSTRSFYSSVSTPDILVFDDSASSVESPKNLLNLPLTEENLKLLLKNFNKYDRFHEERMMQYINRQQYLAGLERKRQNETRTQIIKQSSMKKLADEIWGIRRPMKNKIGFYGGHIGARIIEESTSKENKSNNINSPLLRMFGRIALPFRYFYKQPAHKITPFRHNDEVPQLVAIRYDEWKWHAT